MRWVGAIILIAASYTCGSVLANIQSDELKTVDSVIRFLTYMRRRMYSERAELFEVFQSFKDEHLENLGFLSALCSCRNDFSQNWGMALDLLSMDQESKNELVILGESLGKLNLNEQLKRLDVCINALESSKQKIEKAIPIKQKTTKTIWLLSGTLIAIILL